jgi:hypothetical protein
MNILITDIINDIFIDNNSRKILCLSSRCNHLDIIYKLLIDKDNKYINNIGYYTGKTSSKNREDASKNK